MQFNEWDYPLITYHPLLHSYITTGHGQYLKEVMNLIISLIERNSRIESQNLHISIPTDNRFPPYLLSPLRAAKVT